MFQKLEFCQSQHLDFSPIEAAANNSWNKEHFAIEMYAFLCHSSFTEKAAKEIVRLIGNDPAPYERMEALLKVMEQKHHKVLPEKANKVISDLADLCNPALKKWTLER